MVMNGLDGMEWLRSKDPVEFYTMQAVNEVIGELRNEANRES
jgi:hypothetical protein